jgi:hypothetical protein
VPRKYLKGMPWRWRDSPKGFGLDRKRGVLPFSRYFRQKLR